ncbi:MAG: formyltetrahydrofolate deformylase [Bacilli bacterium]
MKEIISKKLEAQQTIFKNRGRLLINCPDQPGIVAHVSNFLYKNDANIIESSQYSTDPEDGRFFIRLAFELDQFEEKFDKLKKEFSTIAQNFQMNYQFHHAHDITKTAIFVSKDLNCLQELLWAWQNGDLYTDIAMIVSNHPDAAPYAAQYGIPFHHIPSTKANREEAEQQQIQLLQENEIDLIVLARYMQILTPHFVETFPNQIINIHHSFLPAFIGANPYERAYTRGVKLIGATSHYVTNDLDEGPIIEQDVFRVDHRDDSEALKKIGSKVERTVLLRAVRWHLEDRVLVQRNKTIVFA